MSRTQTLHAPPGGFPSKTPPPPPSGSSPVRTSVSTSASRRPSTAPAPVSLPAKAGLGGWLGRIAGRLRDAAEALGTVSGSRRFHEFADLVERSREPEPIEAALVALAGEFSGACRVELLLDRDEKTNPDPKLLIVWPETAPKLTADELEALGYPLCLGSGHGYPR